MVATLQSKAELWDKPKSDQYPIDPTFRWVTQEKVSISPKKMHTHHLFNSLRMIWNHQVPVPYRFMPYKPYNMRTGRARRRECVANLFSELMNRTDRTEEMDNVLRQMARYIVQAKTTKLSKGVKRLPQGVF